MFEYDPEKSAANLAKHGIDFEQAQALWRDDNRVVFPARSDKEQRFMLIARLDGKYWAAFATMRDQIIRIISVRRARPKEVYEYERKEN